MKINKTLMGAFKGSVDSIKADPVQMALIALDAPLAAVFRVLKPDTPNKKRLYDILERAAAEIAQQVEIWVEMEIGNADIYQG